MTERTSTIAEGLMKLAASLDRARRLPDLPTEYRYHATVLRDHIYELSGVFEEVDAFFARASAYYRGGTKPRIEHRKGPRK